MNDLIKKNNTLIGLIIISVLVSFYSYLTKSGAPINKSELVLIEGSLKAPPYLGADGGDMPIEYIRFEIVENQKKYYMKNCAFDMCQKEKILQLEKGDFVRFLINNNRKDESLMVYEFHSGQEELLSLKDFNNCFTTKWRYMIPISLILIGILLLRFILSYMRRNKLKTYKTN